MALQFILGNSGSGKTEYIYAQIAAEAPKYPKKNYLVIVPEQFTMQTQKKLVELSENHAIMNIDVLSFKRLAYRVFDDMGINSLSILEETGKNLVLRRIAKQLEDKLTVLRPNIHRMGYIEELKSLLSELMQYNVTVEQLKEYVSKKQGEAAFLEKLKDITIIYEAFLSYLKGNYITAEEILDVLIQVAKDSKLLEDSVIVFDEFTGFTPIQNQLIHTILPMIDRMYVVLTIDAKESFYQCSGEHELFYLSKKTIHSLLEMAEKAKTQVLEPIVLSDSENKRFVQAKDLAFMEQNLFRKWYQKKQEEVSDIRITCERNPKEEITFAAREISRLIREEGFRYRDIAVVTGAVAEYKSCMAETFAKYEIPFFMDQTTDVLFLPFIECIRAALEIVETNFSYEAMMRFLRTGFTKLSEEDIDLLDHYLVAIQIRGKKSWERRFLRKMKDERLCDLEKLEAIRIELTSLLFPFYDAFHGEGATAKNEIVALYQLLTAMETQEKLMSKEEELLNAGNQDKAKEYGQIYRVVMELLEKYNELLGDEHLTVEEFTDILEAGLSAANVAVIPPGYDSVTIGDIERTRLNGVKILFFVGVNDGIIPKAAGKGGIISEYERQLLKDEKLELAPGAREQAFIQRFYLYRNLTKPTTRLYVSYVKVNFDGKSIRPSYLIETLLRLFPKLSIEYIEDIFSSASFFTEASARDYLVFGPHQDEWYALAAALLQRDEGFVRELLAAPYYRYEADPISKAVSAAIYGKHLKGSVTRLENYATCAYKHFLEYGLKLKQRELATFENVDMGNLYHDALKQYSDLLEKSEYDWFGISDEKRIEFCNQAMKEALTNYPNLSVYATAEEDFRTRRMQAILEQTVWALTKQVRAGKFTPKEFEVSFSNLESLDSLKLSFGADESMQLLGRIDRMDIAEDEEKIYVKIVDYKSGSTKFDLVRIYQGLDLQLATYLTAGMLLAHEKYPNRPVIPGAILYYHIDDPVLDADKLESEDSFEKELLQALRPDGLVNSEEAIYRALDERFEKKSDVIPITLNKSGDLSTSSKAASSEEFAVIEEFVKNQMISQGKEIFAGNVEINPYVDGQKKSCDYCPYESVCGIDKHIPGFKYRRLSDISKEEVIDKMRTENAKADGLDQGATTGN